MTKQTTNWVNGKKVYKENKLPLIINTVYLAQCFSNFGTLDIIIIINIIIVIITITFRNAELATTEQSLSKLLYSTILHTSHYLYIFSYLLDFWINKRQDNQTIYLASLDVVEDFYDFIYVKIDSVSMKLFLIKLILLTSKR